MGDFEYFFYGAEGQGIRGERVGEIDERRVWRTGLLALNVVPLTSLLDVTHCHTT